MLFAVQPAAMNGTESVLNALDAILARAEDEIHELEVARADELEQTSWYRSSRPDRRKLLEEIAEASLHRAPRTRGPHLRRVEVNDATTAADARNVAQTPLRVLLENDVSDGALVRAALRMFGAQQTLDLCFGSPSQVDPPAFEMESRGGHGALKVLVRRRLDEASERGRRARLIVITDSDGEWPGEVKQHALEIRVECAAAGIPCPPLNKRTAENYIPDAVWHAWAAAPDHTAARPGVAALLRLSPSQRDHVNMGRPADAPWNDTNPAVAALFGSVSATDRDALQRTNLKGRGATMMILALDTHAAALTAADLHARDHDGDLQAVVRHIEDEL